MKTSPIPSTVDPLGEALHSLRLRGAFYCLSELTEPWGLDLPRMGGCLWFHVVTTGHGRLEVDAADPVLLRPGDLALVPHGQGHRLRSAADVATPLVTALPHDYEGDRYATLRHGGGGPATRLVCGAVRLESPAARSLIELLPRVLTVEAGTSPASAWLRSTLELMAAEARGLRPGGEAVITRLADILVIQAIRSWIETDPGAQTGWLAALRDPQIGRAISLIHRDPARPWTVESLADELAMSRSAFSARFTDLVGEPAMRYVARWRMQVAVERLREGDDTVGALSSRLGYRSEAAFSRAFKRVVGVPPGAVRRESEIGSAVAASGPVGH